MEGRAKIILLSLVLLAVATVGRSSEAGYQFVLAKILLEEGSYEEAGERFGMAVEEAPDDAFLRVEYADYLLNAGRVEDALSELTVARRLAPDDPLIAKAYGLLELQAAQESDGAFESAKVAFEELRVSTPGDLEIMSTLGRIYLSEQRFAEAADVFREALTYWPRSRSLHGSLIDALLRAGERPAAEAAISEFLEIDPTSVRARLTLAELLRGRGEEVAATGVLAATPRDSVADQELYRRLAVELYEGQAFDDALFWLERSLVGLDEDSIDSQGRFLRALLLTAAERNEDAQAELRALIAAEPERRDAVQLLARHYLQAGDWTGTIELLEPYLEGDEGLEQAELIFLLAEALISSDRGPEALDWLARAAAIEELAPRAMARQAEVLLRLGRDAEADEVLAALTASGDRTAYLLAAEVCQRQEDYERSLPFLEHLVADGSEELQALFWLGAAYERSGRVDEAEAQFRRFLEIEPESAAALNYLGYMWADNGLNLVEALEYVQKAVALDPDNGAYIDSLGWAYFQLGQYQEARTHLERAADLVGEDAVVLEHLGDVYAALGDVDDALRLYRQALDLEGENVEALRDKLRRLVER